MWKTIQYIHSISHFVVYAVSVFVFLSGNLNMRPCCSQINAPHRYKKGLFELSTRMDKSTVCSFFFSEKKNNVRSCPAAFWINREKITWLGETLMATFGIITEASLRWNYLCGNQIKNVIIITQMIYWEN